MDSTTIPRTHTGRAGAAPAARTAAAGTGTLRVGPIEVWPPVVLAPMAGITNAPFRRLCRSFGGADGGLFVSEMITARGLAERNAKTLRLARFADDEPVRSIQLYGTDPRSMREATAHLAGEEAADHIDLNFGCPVAKVTRKGGGAALPVHRTLFRAIVRAAVRGAGDVPVTVKLRIGVDDTIATFLDAGRIARDEGAAAVALHARTAAQHYAGRADWGAIATLRAALPDVPVLGNGDIWRAGDALRMVDETGCDGVVVGRGCLGRPWLFGDLARAFEGRPVPGAPPLAEVVGVLRRHATLLAEWLTEPVAVRDIRKHVGWYLQGYPVGSEVRRRLTTTSTLVELDDGLAALADEHGGLTVVDGADGKPRGKSSGPITVTLPDGWLASAEDPAPVVADELDAVSGG